MKNAKKMTEYGILKAAVYRAFPDDAKTIMAQIRVGLNVLATMPVSKKISDDFKSKKRSKVTSAIETVAKAPLLGVYLASTLSARACNALANEANAKILLAEANAKALAKKHDDDLKAVWHFAADDDGVADDSPFSVLKGVISE